MGLPPDRLQAWASRGRRGALGASGVFGGIVDGNFSGAGGIRGDTEGRSEGTVPRDDRSRPLKGRGTLGGSFVLWKKGRRRGRERMDWRERTVGRGYSWGGAGARDSPPTSCSLGLWGRSGHRSDCHAGGDHGGGWLASASSPPPRRGPASPG